MRRQPIKILFLFVAFCVSTTVHAYGFSVDGINYDVLSESEKTAEVTSGGSYEGDITIPDTVSYNGTTYTVTSIGEGAFSGCSGLTSIAIPDGLTTIGEWAFFPLQQPYGGIASRWVDGDRRLCF